MFINCILNAYFIIFLAGNITSAEQGTRIPITRIPITEH